MVSAERLQPSGNTPDTTQRRAMPRIHEGGAIHLDGAAFFVATYGKLVQTGGTI